MRIIDKPRGAGKTTDLIYLSEHTGYPILCLNKEYVLSESRKLNKSIKVFSVNEYEDKLKHNTISSNFEILIDEIDAVIQYFPEILNCNIYAVTLTSIHNR